jgi:hypothetical protein
MIGFRDRHHPHATIFFGMVAVNAYQQIRRNIAGMDKDLRAGSRNLRRPRITYRRSF